VPFPPDAYLIGSQKSGTTTLAYLLSQHPSICVAKSKEPHFYTTNWYRGLAWYKTEFDNFENTVCVDASTTYSMAPLSMYQNSRKDREYLKGVPKKVHSVNPNAKFIYLLRDPVERTYSAYWHYFTKGRERKSFGEAIRNDCFYLDVSNYYGQLALWLDYFPIEAFLFVTFEDMRKNFAQVAKDCFKFVGLESANTRVCLEEVRNKSRYINIVGRQFNKLFDSLDHSRFGYIAPSYLRKLIYRLTVDYDKEIPKMQEKDRLFLLEYFSGKKSDLELMTNLSLSQWQ